MNVIDDNYDALRGALRAILKIAPGHDVTYAQKIARDALNNVGDGAIPETPMPGPDTGPHWIGGRR